MILTIYVTPLTSDIFGSKGDVIKASMAENIDSVPVKKARPCGVEL